jgi:hypothetical protein
MKHSVKIILVFLLLLSGCGNDPYRRVYETIRNRDDGFKSSAERALSPTPNYGTYKREREQLRHSESATKTNIFIDNKKFDEKHDFNTIEDDKSQELPDSPCIGPCLDASKAAKPNLLRAQ